MRLYLYFARRFFFGLLWLFLAFTALTALVEMIEALRRYDSAQVEFVDILYLTLLRLPASLYEIFPLVVILSTLSVFLSLSKSSELVIARAAGRSALRSLISPVTVALLAGMLMVAVFNPIVAATSKQHDIVANRFLKGQGSVLSFSREGLWLRQGSEDGQVVVHAAKTNGDGTELSTVSFTGFSHTGAPKFRVTAETATLGDGAWIAGNAKRWMFKPGENTELMSQKFEQLEIPTNLTRKKIQDGFGQPSSIPIWELPAFISNLKQAGFSTRRHEIWLQSELALPVLLVTMVLIGAAFTMRHSRFAHTGLMVLMAVIMGFAVFFVRNFALILGENGQIPVLLAAWAPAAAGILFSLGLLLHTEDG